MTKTNLLEKRKKSIEQRINRLQSKDAALNVQLRKQRTRRLIELGGLVSKAGLDSWKANTLFGGLLCLKEAEVNATQLEEWAYKGGVACNEEKIKNVSS